MSTSVLTTEPPTVAVLTICLPTLPTTTAYLRQLFGTPAAETRGAQSTRHRLIQTSYFASS
jgi:hypothetical protein